MAEAGGFRAKQYAFAAHIRDPDGHPAPAAIEDRRMAIYRELFFNNLYKLLGSTFPVLKKLYGADGWRRLVRAFMVRHQASTPYFLEIPKEFIDFLQNEYEAEASDPAFLVELAHYEWAELALSVAGDELPADVDPEGDLLDGVPVKSPLAWSLSYRFPVHRIDESFRPEAPGEQPTFLVVYRDADDELGFMELNPVTARLLELVDDNPEGRSGRGLIERLAREISYPDPAALIAHGGGVLTDMRAAGILLGTRR